jgi:hypothetical protein
MNRKLNTHDIGRLLDRSVAQLDKDILEKLQFARRTALQHQPVTKQAPVLAWLAQHGLIHHHSAHGHKALNFGLAALLAALLLSGALYWQQYYEHDHSDIDIAILTDDLPVDMYVD